ncbi:hypothetical protein CLAIMM_01344 isoform 1 [Cladophialophora immunda]|nr:hypothetical protein CLAIMM_01344 isoform 1 [Cladophialophora immunda]
MSEAMIKSAPSAACKDAPDKHQSCDNKDPISGKKDKLSDSVLQPKCPLSSRPGPYSVGERLFFKKLVDGEREPVFFTVVKVLEGALGKGCTQSCCLLVDIHQVDSTIPAIYHENRCVLKIFDFKHSQGLRNQFNCGVFTPEHAAALNELTADNECLNPVYWLEDSVDVVQSKSTLLAADFEAGAIGPSVSRLLLAGYQLQVLYDEARNEDPNFPSLLLGLAEKEAFLFTITQLDYSHHRKGFDAIDGVEGFPSFVASGFIVRECEEATRAPQLHHYPVIMTSFIDNAITLEVLSAGLKTDCSTNHSDVERSLLQEFKSFSACQWHALFCEAHAMIYKLWLLGLQYDDLRPANIMVARDGPGQFRLVLVDIGGLKVLDQEHVEFYSRDRGQRRYLESRPDHHVWQYEANSKHQEQFDGGLEFDLVQLMAHTAFEAGMGGVASIATPQCGVSYLRLWSQALPDHDLVPSPQPSQQF